MKNRDPLIKIISDQRRSKKDGRYPVKLQIYFDHRQRNYPISLDLTAEEFIRARGEKPRGDAKEWQNTILDAEAKAKRILRQLEPFSFYEFEKQFYDTRPAKSTVYEAFTYYIDILQSEGRHKTAVSYTTARNSIEAFYPGVQFGDLTVPFLKAYEKKMREKGRSDTTIGIYLRSLRTIYNQAIELENVPRRLYPFGRRRYEIPLSRNVKKALTLEEVRRIFLYKAEPQSFADRSKDYWLFSYLCCGMNFKDMALLKYGDIDDEVLVFFREKTKNTSRGNQKPIMVPILPEARAIITKWGIPSHDPTDYIFPIVAKGMSSQRKIAEIGQTIQVTNRWIRKIAKEVAIEKDVTTYVARHTYATVLKRSGASVEFISEQLGHSSVKTTSNYLDSFVTQVKLDMSKRLLDFSALDPNPK